MANKATSPAELSLDSIVQEYKFGEKTTAVVKKTVKETFIDSINNAINFCEMVQQKIDGEELDENEKIMYELYAKKRTRLIDISGITGAKGNINDNPKNKKLQVTIKIGIANLTHNGKEMTTKVNTTDEAIKFFNTFKTLAQNGGLDHKFAETEKFYQERADSRAPRKTKA